MSMSAHRGVTNFCELLLGSLDEFRSFKSTKSWDPAHRFSDVYIDALKQFPARWTSYDDNKISALTISFAGEDDAEHHGFLVTSKSIEHFEISSSKPSIAEHVVGWLCVDVLKRMGVLRSLDSVSTTSLAVKEDLSKPQMKRLIDFFLYFRLQKKTQSSILKKLKARKMPELLELFDKQPAESWSLRKK